MDPRLVPINALLALVRGEASWPRPFGEAGFRLHLLEAPVQTSNGPTVADALLLRNDPPTVVLAEAKSGGNVDVEQAEKYQAADLLALRRSGSIPSSVPEDATLRPLFACFGEHRARVARALADHKIQAALLSIGHRRAILTEGELIGMVDFEVLTPERPPAYFPIDHQSPVEVVIEVVGPALIAAMSRPADVVDLDAFCAATVREWPALGRGSQRPLKNVITTAIRRLQSGALEGYVVLETGGGHNPRIRILRTPRDYKPQGRTQGYQRLLRRLNDETGRARPATIPGQEMLFDDLADLGGLGGGQDG